ncbi:MAG: glycosyltransferase family 2 protein [Candidatus Dadabacteria bacterium]|nr:glycosyltransferase family 2 protein [Candidatus Dadabacteria bacterium]
MTTSKDKNNIELSIVIPVFNETENIKPLIIKLNEVLDKTGKNCEIIMIDDGSTDNSFEVMRELCESYKNLRIIRFRRNFGQTSAFSAGFDLARGGIVVTMDADLQNDPADIPKLLRELDKGYDIVSGWRKKRFDNFLTRQLPSRIANYIISKLTGVTLHDYGCSLKAYRSEVIKNIKLYGEMHRFIPAVASWMGVQVSEIEVNHAPRVSGKSSYGLMRTVRVILDLITVKFLLGYSTKPIQIFGLFGVISLFLGFILAAYLSATKIFLGHPISDRPMLLMAVLLIIFGVQLCSMGLIGEMVVRSYYESNEKPTYMIKEIIETKTIK